MNVEEARAIARKSSPHDPVQAAITEQALLAAGPEHVVSIREVPGGDPIWQGYNVASGNAITFAGLFTYGGDTREEALEAVRRIASKWGWTVVEPEVPDA